jgi:hypothetical protein
MKNKQAANRQLQRKGEENYEQEALCRQRFKI